MNFKNLVVRNQDFDFFKLDKLRILEIWYLEVKILIFVKVDKLRILEIWQLEIKNFNFLSLISYEFQKFGSQELRF